MNTPSTSVLPALLRANRSYRRFGGEALSLDTLRSLIGCCTLTPSAGNLQKLRFCPVTGEQLCSRVYDTLGWAGYLADWDGPPPEERPRGYIVILSPLGSENTLLGIDIGICAQSLLLAATEQGLGGCMLRNLKGEELLSILGLPDECWQVSLVIALGEPRECVEIVPVKDDGSIRYYRDDQGTHYVPKRSIDDLVIYPQ